jgi:anaerobic selenocysteine-containing dehydrogenase
MSANGSMQIVRGACGHDCPDTCSWMVDVQNGTARKLYGNPAHPFTRGTLCAKVNHYLERVYHPNRVLHPLKRVGSTTRSWRSRLFHCPAGSEGVALVSSRGSP